MPRIRNSSTMIVLGTINLQPRLSQRDGHFLQPGPTLVAFSSRGTSSHLWATCFSSRQSRRPAFFHVRFQTVVFRNCYLESEFIMSRRAFGTRCPNVQTGRPSLVRSSRVKLWEMAICGGGPSFMSEDWAPCRRLGMRNSCSDYPAPDLAAKI